MAVVLSSLKMERKEIVKEERRLNRVLPLWQLSCQTTKRRTRVHGLRKGRQDRVLPLWQLSCHLERLKDMRFRRNTLRLDRVLPLWQLSCHKKRLREMGIGRRKHVQTGSYHCGSCPVKRKRRTRAHRLRESKKDSVLPLWQLRCHLERLKDVRFRRNTLRIDKLLPQWQLSCYCKGMRKMEVRRRHPV